MEIIDLCSVSQSKIEAHIEGKSKHDAGDKMEDKLRTRKSNSMIKNEEVEAAMMCWESMNNILEEEPHKEPEKAEKKPIKKMENLKPEEEHVEPTLNKGNRLKNSIEEFSWEREDKGSTLDTEESEQQQVVYMRNLESGLQKVSTKL